MSRARFSLLVCTALVAGAAFGQATPDPRTAAGQLAACGGATAWRAINYLEFDVKVTTPAGVQGPFRYRWDRHNGYLRVNGTISSGNILDVLIDLGSKTGGAWEGGKQLTGKRLSEVIGWALQRFGEDSLWLTFPLDWGQAGVKVTPLPDDGGAGSAPAPATEVSSSTGDWKVTLDPATGRVARTVLARQGITTSATWSDWAEHAGVWFAGKRVVAETGETVQVDVLQAQAQDPPDVF